MSQRKLNIVIGGEILFCVLALIASILACSLYNDSIVANAEEIEYEEEILPDGLYLYSVEGAYLTVGIQTTGSMNGNRACHVTFYGTSEYGENISTYEDIFVQSSEDEYLFEGILKTSCYDISFNEIGTISVIQKSDEVDTPLSFENDYIYLYSFMDNTVEDQCDE